MKKPRTPLEKIKACKDLQGKSVMDICMLPGFISNLDAYVTVQREERKIALDHAMQFGGGKMHAPAHVIDSTMGWDMEQWRDEFTAVLNKTSRQSSAVREYVRQLGMQAYNVTIANIVLVEFPELREYFFGKSKVV